MSSFLFGCKFVLVNLLIYSQEKNETAFSRRNIEKRPKNITLRKNAPCLDGSFSYLGEEQNLLMELFCEKTYTFIFTMEEFTYIVQ